MSRARYEMQDPGADSRSSKISLWGRTGLHDANSFGNHPSYRLTPPWEPSKLGPSWMLWGGREDGGGGGGARSDMQVDPVSRCLDRIAGRVH